jgi:hypothetical protein
MLRLALQVELLISVSPRMHTCNCRNVNLSVVSVADVYYTFYIYFFFIFTKHVFVQYYLYEYFYKVRVKGN